MKKFLAFMLAAVMLLMCGCQGNERPNESEPVLQTENTTPVETTSPTEPETEPTEAETEPTEPETDPTEPAAPVEYELEVEDWLVEQEYLSYEEYFAEDREYGGYSNCAWLKADGDGYIAFSVNLYDAGIVVNGGNQSGKYLVPGSDAFIGSEVLAAGGQYAWISSDREISRVDMVTGENEVLYRSEELISVSSYDNLVIYFFALHDTDEGKLYRIGRIYLPTGQVDILHEGSGEDLYYCGFYKVYSTLGDVRWSMLNPDYVEVLRKELSDPDSEYKNMGNGYAKYWEAEDGIAALLEAQSFLLLDEIEDDSGVRAQSMGVYNCGSGEYSEKLGIFDTCWYGSGYPEDHFNPDVTTADDPIFIKERWFGVKEKANFVLCDPENIGEDGTYVSSNLAIIRDTSSTPYLYFKNSGVYTKVLDFPVKAAVNTSQCIICLTTDDRVLAVSYDGTLSAELYKSVYGDLDDLDVSYYGNFVAFSDGDYVILIDLEKQEYREEVYHTDIHSFYLGVLYGDGFDDVLKVPELYFEIAVGLYVNGYSIDLATGEVIEQYRL